MPDRHQLLAVPVTRSTIPERESNRNLVSRFEWKPNLVSPQRPAQTDRPAPVIPGAGSPNDLRDRWPHRQRTGSLRLQVAAGKRSNRIRAQVSRRPCGDEFPRLELGRMIAWCAARFLE